MKRLFVMFAAALCCACVSCSTAAPDRIASVPDDSAAEVTIFAYGGGIAAFGLQNYGHAFLRIKNVSDTSLEFYHVALAPEEEMTIGLYPNSAHNGIWVDLEARIVNDAGRYRGRYGVTAGATAKSVAAALVYADRHDRWTPSYNCSIFALDMWNLLTDYDLPYANTPRKLRSALRRFSNATVDAPILSEGQARRYDREKNEFLVYTLEGNA